MEPVYDLDGCRFPMAEPSDEDRAIYEEEQRQSAEWMVAGLCMSCGSDGTLYGGCCGKCMDQYYEAYTQR